MRNEEVALFRMRLERSVLFVWDDSVPHIFKACNLLAVKSLNIYITFSNLTDFHPERPTEPTRVNALIKGMSTDLLGLRWWRRSSWAILSLVSG